MREFLAGLRRWYLRRFRGIVGPPTQLRGFGVSGLRPGGQGTTWIQHLRDEQGFTCRCNLAMAFTQDDYRIISQDHRDGCTGVIDRSTGDTAKSTSKVMNLSPCDCPVTHSRYTKICPQCRIGHWKLHIRI